MGKLKIPRLGRIPWPTMFRGLARPADWPLIVKFAIGPAIALAAMLFLAVVGISSLDGARTAARHIVEIDMRDNGRVREVEREFERAKSDLYRLLAAKAANPAHTNVATGTSAIQARLDRVQRDLKALLDSDIGRSNRARIDAATHDVKEYSQAVTVVTSMLDIDFATAVSMVEPFEKKAAHVSTLITELADQGVAQSRTKAEEVSQDVATTLFAYGLLTLIAVVGIAAATYVMGFRTVQSIRAIASATSRLAAADYGIDTASLARGDELGAIVDALETFRTQAQERLRLRQESDALRRQNETDERQRAEAAVAQQRREAAASEQASADRRIMREQLALEFRRSISSVIDAVSRSSESLFDSADQLKASAERTRESSAVMDEETGTLAHSMHRVAEAADELTLSFGEIERQVSGSRDAASTALHESETAGRTVTMLAQDAERIDAIAEMINQVAARTNLLALNASIEAARAGDAGRGFAVVAGEVKSLAGQTASATDDVRGQINGIQASAKHVVGTTLTINRLIDQLNGVMTVVATSVEQQVLAASEITGTMARALGKTRELVDASGEIRRAADANSDAATNVRTAVDELKVNFQRLQADAERFVSHIHADAA